MLLATHFLLPRQVALLDLCQPCCQLLLGLFSHFFVCQVSGALIFRLHNGLSSSHEVGSSPATKVTLDCGALFLSERRLDFPALTFILTYVRSPSRRLRNLIVHRNVYRMLVT